MDVDKVERKLLALYNKMVGPGVWPRTHVIELDAFLLSIKTCVFEFWYPTGEGDWATRWDWKKKTWVNDKQTGMYKREMRLEDEEALIRGKVREELEKAAGMTAFKAKYSKAAQKDFDELLQYVKRWCVADQVKEKSSHEENSIVLMPPALQPTPESPDMRSPAAERRVRPTEEEKLRVIGKRLEHEIVRLNQLRKDVLKLKGYVVRQRENIPSSNDFESELEKIYELFPVEDTAFVVFDMENRLSKDIDVGLGRVEQFLTWFNVADYLELAYIEKKVKAIRDALRELLKDNKSTITEYSEAQKKTSEESNGEDNPPTGDSAAPEEAKGDEKPRLLDRIRNWRPFGKRGNIKSLLLELEALGDDSLYKS
jgi:hypothetical protein